MPPFKDTTTPADVADGGGVMGYAATFDREPDCYGDVIAPSAGSRPRTWGTAPRQTSSTTTTPGASPVRWAPATVDDSMTT